jgi:hypothetical protein
MFLVKVVDSIRDNIGEEELLSYLVKCFLLGDAYEADRKHVPHGQMPAMPEDVPAMMEHQPEGQADPDTSWEVQHDEDNERVSSCQEGTTLEKGREEDAGESLGRCPETVPGASDDPPTRADGRHSQYKDLVEFRGKPMTIQPDTRGHRDSSHGGVWRRGHDASNYRKGYLIGSEALSAARPPYDPSEPDSRIFDTGTMPASPVWVFHRKEGLDGPVSDIAALEAEEQQLISRESHVETVQDLGPTLVIKSSDQDEDNEGVLRAKRPRIHAQASSAAGSADAAPASLHNVASFLKLPIDPYYCANEKQEM